MLGLAPEDVGLLINVSDVRLSPDARQVAFTVQRTDLEHNRYRTQVFVAPVDGSTAPVALSPDSVTSGVARWSPDGARLAFSARAIDDDEAVTELWVAPAGGGEHRVACRCSDAPHELAWSPDGTRLAFVARDPDR